LTRFGTKQTGAAHGSTAQRRIMAEGNPSAPGAASKEAYDSTHRQLRRFLLQCMSPGVARPGPPRMSAFAPLLRDSRRPDPQRPALSN
jgi:hypothetical protein